LTEFVETILREMGYCVVRNSPYAGGYTTRHYGNPQAGVHSLQIEINRRLYMSETSYEKLDGFARLQGQLAELLDRLAAFLEEGRP
jgi:N-formylglutamate deformylase